MAIGGRHGTPCTSPPWWTGGGNLRRVIGWDAQYFATVEPQRRATPHLHAAIRGSIPHEVIRQVTAATYHQVWWPAHDAPSYVERMPVWDRDMRSFVDPDARRPLTAWDAAVDELEQPAHVMSFGEQVHSKGILGGTEEAGRHIGYLTKSTGEVVESTSARQAELAEQEARRPGVHHQAGAVAAGAQLAGPGVQQGGHGRSSA